MLLQVPQLIQYHLESHRMWRRMEIISNFDAKHIEEKVVDLIATKRTKKNPQKMCCEETWISSWWAKLAQVENVILHGDHDEEIYMAQSVGFIVTDLISVED